MSEPPLSFWCATGGCFMLSYLQRGHKGHAVPPPLEIFSFCWGTLFVHYTINFRHEE